MSTRIRIIDAFSDTPFAGNPAAVCVLDGEAWPDEGWMARVAGEMRMPMTAFALRLRDGARADWGLRWFNATMAEDDFCGHATLGTAHLLFGDGLAQNAVRFDTRAGILVARPQDDGAITLDFPAAQVTARDVPDGLDAALGGVHVESAHATGTLRDLLAVVADAAAVRSVVPDWAALEAIAEREDLRGIIVTGPGGGRDGHDFVSRFFSPTGGIYEDAVTGSAHTALAPYWSGRLGRKRLVGLQASARTGVVRTELAGDRVLLTGRAVVVVDGSLLAAEVAPPAAV